MYGDMVWKYATRITPAVSLLLLVVLLVFSFALEPFGAGRKGRHHGEVTIWQWLLCTQILVLHVMSLLFPIRVFYALGDVMKKMKETTIVTQEEKDPSGLERPLLFVIIIPTYKEELETLNNTLSVLAAHPQARFSYHVGVLHSKVFQHSERHLAQMWSSLNVKFRTLG